MRFRRWCYRQAVNMLIRWGRVPDGTAVFRYVDRRRCVEITGRTCEVVMQRDFAELMAPTSIIIRMQGGDINEILQ